jgi:PIN domain nuclease of toxin-antitoxin system
LRLLLDSRAYLWWLMDHRSLPSAARQAIAQSDSVVFVSAATIWELAIKQQLGRLRVEDADLVAEIAENDFLELPMEARHAQRAAALPPHHPDPFDRMLIAQTQTEGLVCITGNEGFAEYGIATLW